VATHGHLASINKQNVENVPVHELVGNNAESVDVNFVRNFGNNGYGNNYNYYNKPPYASNNYGNRPFILYPNANENKWKLPLMTPLVVSKRLTEVSMEQVFGHSTMIEELNKSLASISSDIRGLQTQAAGLDKSLSKLADNQATLLSMSVGKPQAPPIIGMNSIVITENTPLTLEELKNIKITLNFYYHLCNNLFVWGKKLRK
jgi:hypothetical protein